MTEKCTITITMRQSIDDCGRYREEDIVKDVFPRMTPWFTRRHGVENGKMIFNDGAIEVEWRYETLPDQDEVEDDAEPEAPTKELVELMSSQAPWDKPSEDDPSK